MSPGHAIPQVRAPGEAPRSRCAFRSYSAAALDSRTPRGRGARAGEAEAVAPLERLYRLAELK